MRAFDRDLIRGGHYGQRSCEPHSKAEHMAAPTNAANVKKALANPEPSTHGRSRPAGATAVEGQADLTVARRDVGYWTRKRHSIRSCVQCTIGSPWDSDASAA